MQKRELIAAVKCKKGKSKYKSKANVDGKDDIRNFQEVEKYRQQSERNTATKTSKPESNNNADD